MKVNELKFNIIKCNTRTNKVKFEILVKRKKKYAKSQKTANYCGSRERERQRATLLANKLYRTIALFCILKKIE